MPIPQYLISKRKICLICEGFEEKYYLEALLKLKVWNNRYDITIINAKSNGNIFPRYQYSYQSNRSEAIFVFCDTDKKPHTQYIELREKINNLHNRKNIADDIIIFSNPSITQIIIYHWCDNIFKTQGKNKFAPIIEKYTGVKDYDPHENQLEEMMKYINKENYNNMKNRIKDRFDYREAGNSNFLYLLENLESDDTKWIKALNNKICK